MRCGELVEEWGRPEAPGEGIREGWRTQGWFPIPAASAITFSRNHLWPYSERYPQTPQPLR